MNDLKSCRNCARLGRNDRICQACRDQNRWVAMKPPQTDYTAYSGTAYPFPRIKKVIFNDPATIVLWDDNTKTVVKCSENDDFDWEKGLAMAISKKFFGNQGNYYNNFKKWEPEEPEECPEAISIMAKQLANSICQNATESIGKIREELYDLRRSCLV